MCFMVSENRKYKETDSANLIQSSLKSHPLLLEYICAQEYSLGKYLVEQHNHVRRSAAPRLKKKPLT